MRDSKNQTSAPKTNGENAWSSLQELDHKDKMIDGSSDESSDEPLAAEQKKGKLFSSAISNSIKEYDSYVRDMIDMIKWGLRDPSTIDEYEERQIASQPNTLTKLARVAMDKLGVKTRRGEERRRREAMHVALAEYRKEEEDRKKERERAERESVERYMQEARDHFNYKKLRSLKKQRVQEIVERDLNSRLLKVEDLETEAISENPEVQKRFVPWDDGDVPVYDLRGTPFCTLSTTIDYRRANRPGDIGTETFKKLMDDPAIWMEWRHEAEKTNGFGTRFADARGDTISASYRDSEYSFDSYVPGDLIYGFENVQADSIIDISVNDGATSNMAGKIETQLENPDAIKKIVGPNRHRSYNEVLLRRYAENGAPKKPDYIIVDNGKVTNVALRHAKYFGIPIINIEKSVYGEKAKKKTEKLAESIDENDSYEELNAKIVELMRLPNRIHDFLVDRNVRVGHKEPSAWSHPDFPLDSKFLEISKMEFNKRLDFIKNMLEKTTEDIETATRQRMPTSLYPPRLDFFKIEIEDIHNQVHSEISTISPTITYDESNAMWGPNAHGLCNWIDVVFRLKGSDRTVETRILDDEKIFKVEKALAEHWLKKEDLDGADSSLYNMFEPIARKYIKACLENKRLRGSPRP